MSKPEVYCDVVAGIPFGTEGRKRWQKVGVMLKYEKNDQERGPGFVIMLDKHFNPAGIYTEGTISSVPLSTYWVKEREERRATGGGTRTFRAPHEHEPGGEFEDDIPF